MMHYTTYGWVNDELYKKHIEENKKRAEKEKQMMIKQLENELLKLKTT